MVNEEGTWLILGTGEDTTAVEALVVRYLAREPLVEE